MKNIKIFLSENFQFLVENFSVYLNRRVFVMGQVKLISKATHTFPSQVNPCPAEPRYILPLQTV